MCEADAVHYDILTDT